MDYRIGDWVKLKQFDPIQESIREIRRYNQDCEWDEEEFDDFDNRLKPFLGKICIIEDYDEDDSSYEISIPNDIVDDTFWIHSDWVEPVKTYATTDKPDGEQPRFKEGDDVTITGKDNNSLLHWNSNMKQYIGMTTTVTHVYPHGYLLENCSQWVWSENNLTTAIEYHQF